MSNILTKKFIYPSFVLVAILLSNSSLCQKRIIGKVCDADTKKPIENVSIIKYGTLIGTVSNSLGYFELLTADTDSLILTSHLSYEEAILRIPDSDRFVFYLKRNRTQLPLLDIRHFRNEVRYDIDTSGFYESSPKSKELFAIFEERAEFPGGNEGLFNYFGDNFALTEPAKDSLVEGVISVFFTVDNLGNATNITATGDTAYALGDLMIKIVQQMPKWKPAKQRGISVEQDFQVDISISNELFVIVEEMATYPGGMKKFQKYVDENLNYPEEARINNIKGTIIVYFVVNRNGAILPKSVKALNSLGFGLDEEAIRLIKNSSPWLPGRQRGKSIALKVNVPIIFK